MVARLRSIWHDLLLPAPIKLSKRLTDLEIQLFKMMDFPIYKRHFLKVSSRAYHYTLAIDLRGDDSLLTLTKFKDYRYKYRQVVDVGSCAERVAHS